MYHGVVFGQEGTFELSVLLHLKPRNDQAHPSNKLNYFSLDKNLRL